MFLGTESEIPLNVNKVLYFHQVSYTTLIEMIPEKRLESLSNVPERLFA